MEAGIVTGFQQVTEFVYHHMLHAPLWQQQQVGRETDTLILHVAHARPLLWLSALSMALFPTALSLLCTSAAIQRIGSTPVAILGALEPVTAVAIAVLLFNEVLTLRLAIGMLLVILAVTLIIGGPTVSHHILRVRKMFPKIKKRR